MQRSVLKRGNPILEKVCQPVTDIKQMRDIISDMSDTLAAIRKLYDFKRGHGIAAPQIGHLVRINIAEYGKDRYVLINPKIVDHSEEKIQIREGCLSFFEYRGNAPRYKSVIVSATDENGSPYTIEASDEFAVLLQHELDHLDGILYVNYLPEKDKDLYLAEGVPSIP